MHNEPKTKLFCVFFAQFAIAEKSKNNKKTPYDKRVDAISESEQIYFLF